MSEKRVHEVALSEIDTGLLSVAMEALDTVFAAEVIAILGRDAHGIFICPKPGMGRPIMHFLQSVDWDKEVRIAEEHFE